VAYRPLRKRHSPKLVYLITAIGASIFLYNLAGKLFGRNNLQVPESTISYAENGRFMRMSSMAPATASAKRRTAQTCACELKSPATDQR